MKLFFCGLFFLLFAPCHAQNTYELEVNGGDFDHRIKKQFNDSISIINYLRSIQEKAIKKGFLLFSIDSIRYSNYTFHVTINQGEKMGSIYLLSDKKELEYQNLRFAEKLRSKSKFTPQDLALILKKELDNSINNGFPFASIRLDSISYFNNDIYGKIVKSKGPYYKWSKIHIKGDSSISSKTISALLNFKIGDPYSEEVIRSISEKISQVTYLQEIKPSEVLFTPDGAELFIYVKSIPVSSINGLIGLQPNPVTQRVTFTGEVNLRLLNVLRRGELIQLNWRSIQSGVQSLNIQMNYPFLFKTSFGLDGGFQLYKRDSTFLETKSMIGVQYMLNGGSILKVFFQNHTSSMLNQNYAHQTYTSLRNNQYGLSFSKTSVDYLPNPSKGQILYLEGAGGTRITGIGDTLPTNKTYTFRALLKIQFYLPLSKRQVIRVSNLTESYYAPEIFRNELFRFGGLNSLRGFNEEEIFASTRSVFSLEYRFLTDRNSHAFAFYDLAIYENTSEKYVKDIPFGFGAGFSFGTKLGVFSISYALGKQFDNPIELKNGKIHFGYIAYF